MRKFIENCGNITIAEDVLEKLEALAHALKNCENRKVDDVIDEIIDYIKSLKDDEK